MSDNWIEYGLMHQGLSGETRTARPMRPFLLVKRLPHGANLPEIARQTEYASGFDLYAAITEPLYLHQLGDRIMVPTGIAVDIIPGFEGQVRPRSGLSAKEGVVSHFGTIDSDYRGEIKVVLYKQSPGKFVIEPGMRIAQLVIAPVAIGNVKYVEELDNTVRGEGGFGSTGVSS